MTFAKPTDTPGQPLNVIYAEHILQLIGVLTGEIDGGALQFLGQVAAPATAPTVTLSAGALNGSYEWGTYWITGAADGTGSYAVTGRTTPSPYSAAQTLANQQGTVSIAGQAIPTGVVGWGVVRNQAGGGTWYEVPGSEQFMNSVGVMPTSFVDNVSDGNLVTAAPGTNTTGTSLSGTINAMSLANGSSEHPLNVESPDGSGIWLAPSLALSAYNPLVQAGDQGLIWQSQHSNGTTAYLSIVPWSVAASGIRLGTDGSIEGARNVFDDGSGNMTLVGNSTMHALFLAASVLSNQTQIMQSTSTVNGVEGSVLAVAEAGVAWKAAINSNGDMGLGGGLYTYQGQLGSASGTWTPASGSLNVASGTPVNIAAIPSGAKMFMASAPGGSVGWVPVFGFMNSGGSNWIAVNGPLSSSSAAVNAGYANSISASTVVDAISTLYDGSYHALGYFQINNGYLQFVVTGQVTADASPATTLRWAVS